MQYFNILPLFCCDSLQLASTLGKLSYLIQPCVKVMGMKTWGSEGRLASSLLPACWSEQHSVKGSCRLLVPGGCERWGGQVGKARQSSDMQRSCQQEDSGVDIHALNTYLLSTYGLGPVLGTWDNSTGKQSPAHVEAILW